MNETSKVLLRVSRKAQGCIGIIIKKYGVTIAEHPFIMTIRFNDGLTQEELSNLVGVDKALTARVVKSLEQKGLIRKEHDAKDKRYNFIFANDSLHELVDKIIPELFAFNDAATNGISEDDIQHMLNTLNRMENNLDLWR